VYTARALLAFSDLNTDATEPPRDVNLGRVAARAALGCEPHQARPATLDSVLREGRPAAMSMREYAYALFDVGAMHCRARPLCGGCPVAEVCAWRGRGEAPSGAGRPGRQTPYRGSLRQLRGALLAQALRNPQAAPEEVTAAISAVPGATPERIRSALAGLVSDGLIAGGWTSQR
jgi:A/G-specific adenine glycosylase